MAAPHQDWPRSTSLGDWRVSRDFLAGALAGCAATVLLWLVARVAAAAAGGGGDGDMYDLRHWRLNVRVPMQQPMWMNMGYWKTRRGEMVRYMDEACARLLGEILDTAGLVRLADDDDNDDVDENPVVTEGTRRRRRQLCATSSSSIAILDVGIGCGDQTVELARALDAASWKRFRYVGLGQEGQHLRFAQQRVPPSVEGLSSSSNGRVSFGIFAADAALPASWSRHARDALTDAFPTDGDNGQEGVTPTRQQRWLLALDCMYHFRPSRQPLLRHAAGRLGANLMAFDLVLGGGPDVGTASRLAARLMGCVLVGASCLWSSLSTDGAAGGLLTEERYRAQLVAAGYDGASVVVRDVSGDVFEGLAAHMARQQRALRPYRVGLGVGLAVARRLFGWMGATGAVRAVIVVARVEGKG